MSELKIQGEVSLSSENAETALDRVGEKAGRMATRMQTEADKAGKAVDGIGSGAEQSAQQFTRAEGRISDSIKRATKNLENLGKTASQKLEIQISEKGLDAAKFEPMLARLREVESQSAKSGAVATASMAKIGQSANQTSAALRMVPAQMTDIVTSLQGGQAPMTVLLQQGGQLKDMFGGIGPAAKALGGYIAGLVNPFTLTAAAAGTLAYAYSQGSKEADAYAKSLILTGNAAGASVGKMQDMAASIADGLDTTKGAASAAIVAMADAGNVGAAQMEKFSAAALKMQKSAGVPIADTAKAFSELGAAPTEAVAKLNEKTNFLTAALYDQIKALEDQGQKTEAARVAQEAYADAMEIRADKLTDRLGYVERAWRAVGSAGKWAWDQMLDVGRADSPLEEISKLQDQLMYKTQRLAKMQSDPNETAAYKKQLAEEVKQLQAVLAAKTANISATNKSATADAAAAAQTKANISWVKEGEKYLSKQAQMEREIAKARAEGAAAGASAAEIESRIAGIRGKYTEKTKEQISDYARLVASIKEKISAQNIELATGEKANEGEKLRAQIIEQTLSGQLKLTAAQKESVLAMAAELDAKISVAAANKEIAAAQEKFAADAMKSAESIYKQATEQEKANAVFGKAKSSVQELTLAEMERALQMQLMSGEYVPGLVDAMESQIDAQKRLIAAMQEGENLETGKKMAEESKKAAEDTAKEWQKTADKINDSLTDALMRGFENGKGFAENIRDTIVNMFKTMVLRPTISAVLSPISAVLAGSTASGAAGASGLLTTASNTSSIIGAVSTLGGAFGASFSAGLTTTLASGFGTLGLAVEGGLAMAAEGGIAAGLGQALGAISPILLGAGAIYLLATSFKGETRDGGSYAWGDSLMNGAAGTYDDVTYIHGPSGGEIASDAVKEAITNTIGGINDVLESVGSTLTLAGFQAALETSGKGRGGVLAGGTLSDGTTFGEAGTGSNYAGTYYESWSTQSPDAETALNNLATDLQQATLQALMAAADVPKSVKNIIGDIDIEAMTADETTALLTSVSTFISGVNALRTTLDYMPISNLQDATFEVIGSLAEIAGGVDSLTTSIDTYYQSYYSEAERMAASTDQLSDAFAVLGYTMPETKEAFRALVEGIDLTTEAGRESYMSLIGLSSAFAQVADYATSAADAAEQAAAAIEQAAAAQLASITGWQDQIDLLLGNVTQTQLDRRNALDAALSPAEQDLINQYYNLVELNDAVTAAQAALQSAQSAQVDALNSNISALQDQATTASALAKEMASAADSLSKYLTSLQASTGSPEQQLAAAKAAFGTTAKKAMLGDTDAMGELTSLADAYLSLSKEAASSLDQYARDQAAVERALKQSISVAARQSDLAQDAADSAAQQISLLQSQIDALSTVNGSVLSVADAVQAMADAQANLDNATQATALYQQIHSDYERYFDMAAVGDSMSWAGGTLTRTDAGAEYTDPTGVIVDLVRNASITALAATNDYLAQSWVKQYGSLPAFASGGYHTGGIRLVGENGPELEVTGPSRIYSASDTRALLSGGSDELVSEIKSLRAEVASLRASSESTARNTYQSRKLQERWDGDGMPEVRAA